MPHRFGPHASRRGGNWREDPTDEEIDAEACVTAQKNGCIRDGSLRFRVEPSEPRGGIGRFDLGGEVCFRSVGLRSQSLADPTLSLSALSGRRAVYR